ncbi:NifU family protein [Polaribacter cellanae]|uniref:NifU family protein n=1 Tax=Polaribacter cellanae TaxID=2818493 RepID=A0A975CN68_9FLAO|nr:NifU family protein [Polaribacter cellanae]QTE21729.1 NifU family protein [Polaribacter cellanae]
MPNIKITIQETTNNTIIKYNSSSILINGGSYEFNNIDEAKNSPLAQQLFYLPFVKKVFITANFIAIQRFDILEWIDVQEEVKEQIEVFLNEGNAVVNEEKKSKKESIEVYAEVTPNPSVMKFGTNKALTQTDVEFKNIDEASKSSPLALAIFNFPFVKEVFISDNYISITKYDMVEWNEVYGEVRTFIREYLAEGKTIIKELPREKIVAEGTKEIVQEVKLEGVSAQIVDILDEYIKPAVAGDGGNIAFRSYDEANKVVSVVLQGACSGCPSSTATLKNGIENLLKEMLPNKINEVVAING